MSRQRSLLRRLVSLLGASAIVFAQMAMAAHACAALFAGAAPQSVSQAAPSHESMRPGPEGAPCGEPGRPAHEDLCFHHCLTEQQSIDQHPIAFGAPVAWLVRCVEAPDHSSASRYADRDHSHALLARVTAPPLSVRNCCFRT
jgi:hypothetical protein